MTPARRMIGISPSDEAIHIGRHRTALCRRGPDDQYHERAQKELKRLNRDRRPVVVAYPILLESYALVLYRLGKEAASKWLGGSELGQSGS